MSIGLNHFSDLAVLETKRLILKPLNTHFLSLEYVHWMNDEKVNRYLESGGDYTIEKLTAYLKEVEDNPKYFWAIELKSSGKHIGNIKIDPIDLEHGSGEYGIMIGDINQWGKGYAKEASLRIIDHCFNELHLSKITLGVIDQNIEAFKLYKKRYKDSDNNSPQTSCFTYGCK